MIRIWCPTDHLKIEQEIPVAYKGKNLYVELDDSYRTMFEKGGLKAVTVFYEKLLQIPVDEWKVE